MHVLSYKLLSGLMEEVREWVCCVLHVTSQKAKRND